MSEQQITINEMGEEEVAEDNINNNSNTNTEMTECELATRKERRKTAKKEKRKKKRKEMAEMARREEEARLNDPEEQLRLQAVEEQEKARVEKERREFEERERKILEEWERRRAEEQREEERRRKAQEEEDQLKQNQVGYENEVGEDGWEYVEEGPPEIIWQGNEIIVKKKKIRVKKKDAEQQITKEDPNRPTSNPLPPQLEAFADYKNTSVLSAQQLLENVAQETPNFGTEQDKAHCPFHLKTGACRFGSRCSRIHFYPDKSCTLLIKNMYNGPGLAWEQDEGLEDLVLSVCLREELHHPAVTVLESVSMLENEEAEHAYEEFYEDVHTEFLKFGEIVNFKVCRNGSSHLRGNVYVHYKSLDSAVQAYESANGRYFAGKQRRRPPTSLIPPAQVQAHNPDMAFEQLNDPGWKHCYLKDKKNPNSVMCKMNEVFGFVDVEEDEDVEIEHEVVQCEFIGVTRWKVAICGEFMKSKFQTCSRGTACNFIHCFRNPGGDYEWADWDKPAPKYCLKKMAALFGYPDESGYEKQIERGSPRSFRNSSRTSGDFDRYHSRRSQSRETGYSRSSRNYSDYSDDDDFRSSSRHWRHRHNKKLPDALDDKQCDDTSNSRDNPYSKNANIDSDSDRNWSDKNGGKRSRYDSSKRNRSPDRKNRKSESQGRKHGRISIHDTDSDENTRDSDRDNYKRGHSSRSRRHRERRDAGSRGNCSDEDRLKISDQSGSSSRLGQQNKVSTSPDDRWRVRSSTDDSDLTGDWSDGERDSPRSDGSEEFEDKKFKRQCAHKLKHSSVRDHLGRRNGEVEHDSGIPRNSDSSSKSRKGTGKLGLGESEKEFSDHLKKSKRKRDADKKSVSEESRIQCHKVKRPHATDYQIDEATDERGRWEPDK
ncbi:hypothetical protein DH2020_003058 [Rehmannia glutinosa]|uniref:Zinc finger CCCH domain-containing protein n=1 Tax=Rehmannia glutinosa TaxID=99300 RepID=A0ABR0XKI3_REHGL